MLRDAAGQIQHDHPGLRVETEVTVGNPTTVLVDESRGAALVVLGSRGLGGFTGLLVGSVSTQVATHARAPVIVVRGAPRDDPHAPPAPGDGSGRRRRGRLVPVHRRRRVRHGRGGRAATSR